METIHAHIEGRKNLLKKNIKKSKKQKKKWWKYWEKMKYINMWRKLWEKRLDCPPKPEQNRRRMTTTTKRQKTSTAQVPQDVVKHLNQQPRKSILTMPALRHHEQPAAHIYIHFKLAISKSRFHIMASSCSLLLFSITVWCLRWSALNIFTNIHIFTDNMR